MRWTESTCFKEDLLTLKRRSVVTPRSPVKLISNPRNPKNTSDIESLPHSYPQPIVTSAPQSEPPALKRDDSSAYSATITDWSESDESDEPDVGHNGDSKTKRQKQRNNIRRTSSFAIGHTHRRDSPPVTPRSRGNEASSSTSTPMKQGDKRDSAVMTYVFLSENDAIVGSQSMYNYLTSDFNDPDVKTEGNKIVVQWLKNFQHAQFLFSGEAQTLVLKTVVD
jgi:hypothetical protein